MGELDYRSVQRYWSKATPSVLGPYMMADFGFPAGAGSFRFRAERSIVRRLIANVNTSGTVLDLGSGIGFWAEFFGQQFAKVVAIESSPALFEALEKKCRPYPNVETLQTNVFDFAPEGPYSLMFFGGMLMYLKTDDVIRLLRKLRPFLESGGTMLCRETTVRTGTEIRQGEYQAVYRSLAAYSEIFEAAGLTVSTVEPNPPYVLLQMGCEAIRRWKEVVPEPVQAIPLVGRMAYWTLRLCAPWASRVPELLGVPFPRLMNHFFVLRASPSEA